MSIVKAKSWAIKLLLVIKVMPKLFNFYWKLFDNSN